MKLIIVHHHFRPGGVRRVIELATPGLVRAFRPRLERVCLASGEAPEAGWLDTWRLHLAGVPVSCHVEAALGYVAEQRRGFAAIAQRLREFLGELLRDSGEQTIVWAHNQGLGRNLLLTRELVQQCSAHSLLLLLHHHDWWFDNRWQRWPEMRRSGFRSLRQVAETVFPTAPNVRVIAISQADARLLKRHLCNPVAWLPNPTEEIPLPPPALGRRARRWLDRQLREQAPVWLLPCRLVRRKNILEALLLTRWLRPEAWLVTTGPVSSQDELPYARCLAAAIKRHGWKLRLAILHGDQAAKPTVPHLSAACEVVLLTSLQEGFGLPYLEAARAGKPLIARSLPNMAPDLDKFGFQLPHTYEEVWVTTELFDSAAERKRQQTLFREWRRQLPLSCRGYVAEPWWFLRLGSASEPVPFSRLTLSAQLEVLSWPAADSFAHCAPLNPALISWRAQASSGELQATQWPLSANHWLSASAYGQAFSRLIQAGPHPRQKGRTPVSALENLLRWKLASDNLYPLLWSTLM